MTTIAYRDGILAADSAATRSEWISGTVSKIVPVSGGRYVAAAGDLCEVHAFVDWVDAGMPADRLPRAESVMAIVATPGLGAVMIEGASCREPRATSPAPSGCLTVGSGWPVAMAAMMAGATADEAVAIACELDPYSRKPVMTVSVADPR